MPDVVTHSALEDQLLPFLLYLFPPRNNSNAERRMAAGQTANFKGIFMADKQELCISSKVTDHEITEAKIIEYLDATGKTKSLLDSEKKLYIGMAKEFSLNPFKREIHITAYGEGQNRQCSIVVGYEVYIKRAERTGKLDGWEIKTEGEGNNLKAIVKIYRKDMKYPFMHEVYYNECVQTKKDGSVNSIWAKQPRFMTKKVAIGQAFRLCFSDDLGGMPYEEAEMPQEEMKNVTEPEPEKFDIPRLKRDAWELIKLLSENERTEWVNRCAEADGEKLIEIIRDVDELINIVPEGTASTIEEIPIF